MSRSLFTLLLLAAATLPAAERHAFTLSADAFLLDGRPLQIISGEMHPARIPEAYWRRASAWPEPWA